MASKRENQALTFIGVDPGEVHCGWAKLNLIPGKGRTLYIATCGVVHIPSDTFKGLIDMLVPERPLLAHRELIVEEYRQRPVGHQAFKQSTTAQLIGGFRYVAEKYQIPLTMIPAGDPDAELDRLVLGRYIKHWSARWRNPGNKNWQHARAAWRVLARHLLTTRPELLVAIDNYTARDSMIVRPGDEGYFMESGIEAPQATWESAV